MRLRHYFAFGFYLKVLWLTTQGNNNVTYIKTIIEQQINDSINYEFPTDATKYRSSNCKINDGGTFDFIVVGAGSAGSVIANRLSEIQNWKILLLEAGNFGNDVTDIPNMATANLLSDYNWGYKSVPQSTACLDFFEQKCNHNMGRGIGGTSLINGMVYSRGNREDFDRWYQEGNPGWAYNEVLPIFKKSENFTKRDLDVVVDWEYHGKGGNLNVGYPIPRHPLTNNWINANKEKGYNIVDYNGKQQTGAAVTQINTKNGKRADTGNAFIKGLKNLTILSNSYVTKVVIKNKIAIGVQFTYQRKNYIAKIKKEVILSAGAIGSSKILLLSGIGPRQNLEKLGIESVADLQVGTKLKNHPTFTGLVFTSNYTEDIKSLEDYVREYLNGTGALTSPYYNGGLGFYSSKFTQANYPDIELIMTPVDGFTSFLGKQLLSLSKIKTNSHINGSGSFLITVVVLHTKSTGSIKLKSKDPFIYPLIDSNLLSDSDNHDIDIMYEGVKIALNLVKSSAYAKINASLIKQEVPACESEEYLTDGYWFCILRYFTMSGYHDVSTCPMGPNPKTHVVNYEAKVYGIENLRVADSSIFPFTLSGHPNAVCIMIGEKISEMIKMAYT